MKWKLMWITERSNSMKLMQEEKDLLDAIEIFRNIELQIWFWQRRSDRRWTVASGGMTAASSLEMASESFEPNWQM